MRVLLSSLAALVLLTPIDELLIVAVAAWVIRRKATVR